MWEYALLHTHPANVVEASRFEFETQNGKRSATAVLPLMNAIGKEGWEAIGDYSGGYSSPTAILFKRRLAAK